MAFKKNKTNIKKRVDFVFIFSIITSVFLAIIKFVAGFISGNISVISMGMDSFLDILFTNFNYFTVKEASKPADKSHPFGHGKFENVMSLIQSLTIFVLGLYLLYKGVNNLITHQNNIASNLSIIVMGISTFFAALLTYLLTSTGKKANSVAMITDALHYKTDILSNGAIFIGIFAGKYFSITWMDNILGILVALYICYSAGELFLRSFKVLTDSKVPLEIERKIISILDSYKNEMIDYHDLKSIKSGSVYLIIVHITACRKMSLDFSHKLADRIENDIMSNIPKSIITIHFEPCEGKDIFNSKLCKNCLDNILKNDTERKLDTCLFNKEINQS